MKFVPTDVKNVFAKKSKMVTKFDVQTKFGQQIVQQFRPLKMVKL